MRTFDQIAYDLFGADENTELNDWQIDSIEEEMQVERESEELELATEMAEETRKIIEDSRERLLGC